jgi:hypothetical protein
MILKGVKIPLCCTKDSTVCDKLYRYKVINKDF